MLKMKCMFTKVKQTKTIKDLVSVDIIFTATSKQHYRVYTPPLSLPIFESNILLREKSNIFPSYYDECINFFQIAAQLFNLLNGPIF